MKRSATAVFLLVLLALAAALLDGGLTGASPGTTELVSVDSAGSQGNGFSERAISADGRFVAFLSLASNLVPGDANDKQDVFVHDRQTGSTELVSVSSGGDQGNDDTWDLAISADGRFVAFLSLASNLVPGDTNDKQDIFVHDRQTGTTELVSVSSGGDQGNDDTLDLAISADGCHVAFHSDASNLVLGDTNDKDDLFVHDRQTGIIERVSVDSGGNQGNGGTYGAAVSADGRYVAFHSDASNLVLGDTNDAEDVFVHDRGTTPATPTPPAGPTRALQWDPGWHNGAWSGPDAASFGSLSRMADKVIGGRSTIDVTSSDRARFRTRRNSACTVQGSHRGPPPTSRERISWRPVEDPEVAVGGSLWVLTVSTAGVNKNGMARFRCFVGARLGNKAGPACYRPNRSSANSSRSISK